MPRRTFSGLSPITMPTRVACWISIDNAVKDARLVTEAADQVGLQADVAQGG